MSMSSNMALLKLDEGSSSGGRGTLLAYNVVEPTPKLRALIEENIKFDSMIIIVPNREHVMYFADFFLAFEPRVQNVFCPPRSKRSLLDRLAKKLAGKSVPQDVVDKIVEVQRRDPQTGVQPLPTGWPYELDVTVVEGVPRLTELAVFHRPSKMLLICDMLNNCDSEDLVAVNKSWARPFALRYWAGPADILGTGVTVAKTYTMLTRDKNALRASADVIAGWNWEGVIMGHGTPISSDAEQGGAHLRREWRQNLETRLLQ